MSTGSAVHRDVASYALGVLDERDAARFEDHLAQCRSCAAELEGFLPVASLLSEVDADSFVDVEETYREGRMLGDIVSLVSYERNRARSRRVLTLAAASILVVLVLGVGVVLGGQFTGGVPGQGVALPGPTTSPPDFGTGGPGPGEGGPAGPAPEVFETTDPATKATAKVLLEDLDWGTQVSLELAGVKGPLTCQLVAVGSDSSAEVISTWRVPNRGYGTQQNPRHLIVPASTSLQRDKIDHLEVQTVDENSKTGLLISIPAHD